jgi:thiol:disulfide interchange protein DsbD
MSVLPDPFLPLRPAGEGQKKLIFLFVYLLVLLPLWAQSPFQSIPAPSLEKPAASGFLQNSLQNEPQPPKAIVSVFPSPVELDENGTARATVRYIFPEGFHQSLQEDFFTVRAPESSPFPVLEVIYLESGKTEEGVLNYYGSADLEIVIGMLPGIDAGEYRLPLTASYQLCDEAGTCYFPESEEVEIVLSLSEEIAATYKASTNHKTSAVAFDDARGSEKTGILRVLQFLLFAFVGGLLLNVMPCVLPVLSIRALNLVKQSGQKRRDIFFNSLFYTLGVVTSLLLLAGVVILLKFSGELVGWGFQFQNPLFTVFLITVVFVFSLSLFDVYVFQAPIMNRAVQRASRKGYVGSFFNGIIAVLLATPCTAPLLGTALGFAFSQDPLTILGIFTLIGLGFALPFLLIGIKPGVIQKIPKPGPWMNTFKELMGFVLLGTVLYLFSILRYQINTEDILKVFLFLLLLGFFLWAYGKMVTPAASPKKRWIILGLLVILSFSAAGRLLRFDGSPAVQTPAAGGEWEHFSPDALERYRSEGSPVLVIFSAKWCTVCKLNEQSVLKTERARALFEERGVRLLYGDFTNGDPVIEEWIRSYGRAGVPVYAYYTPEGSLTLLPEVLSFSILEEKLGHESG